jgi:CheY-like chemotaxis protein/HPt (histidine-containing phosphotransfer) domain-containing protein
MSIRVLHVEDDPLILTLVRLSLALDPEMIVFQCESGIRGLQKAIEWNPDLILSDVLMPDMDGPAMLSALRLDPAVSNIPVVFMTSRVQGDECHRLLGLGARGVISKPFELKKLPQIVRGYLETDACEQFGDHVRPPARDVPSQSGAPETTLSVVFAERLQAVEETLAEFRSEFKNGQACTVPEGLQSCVHKLAGTAAMFGLPALSASASALEHSIIDNCAGHCAPGVLESSLDALLESIVGSKSEWRTIRL